MAVIAGYTSLLTAVSDYLARSALTTFTPNFVQNFEERFYRNPKNYGPWMEAAYSAAMSSGVSAVPTGFLGWKVVNVSMSPNRRLKPTGLAQLHDEFPRSGSTGIPSFIARNGSNFEYGPFPSSNYTVTGSYYLKPTLLRSFAADAAAHYLVVNAPDMLLYGALLEAAPFMQDDGRLPTWQGFLETARNDYRDLQKQQDCSGGPMQVRAG
jgi:hypothetical protein